MLYDKLAIFLVAMAGSCRGQCNGPPLILMPNNSTGNLGFPESNLDSISGKWLGTHFYPPSVQCTWILKAPPAHVINMRFIYFNTEETFDYVTIYSSLDRSNGTGLFQFSGTLVEEWEAVTPDNLLVLDFVSDEHTTFEGFHLAYRYMPKACVPGGVILEETQLVALPPWNLQGTLPGPPRQGYEPMIVPEVLGQFEHTVAELTPQWVHVSNYPPGLNCTWQLSVDTRDIIELKFLRFHTSPSDFLQIWKVAGHKVVPFKKFWDGNQPDQKILSSSPLIMNFVSNYGDENLGAGFLLNVTYLARACSKDPQEITAPRGFIPYPEGNFVEKQWQRDNPIHYGPDNCTWILHAPKGYVINITIEEINTREDDQIEIVEENNLIMEYGGTVPIQRSITSATNKVVITFKSQTDSENSGFLLHYSWILKDCKYQLPPGGGEVRSPYYPDTYGSQLQCQWTLAPVTKSHIVHFVMLRLHMDEGDFLQMSDGNENILLTKDSKPMSKIEFSSAFPIVINFLSDSSANRGYFYFKYTVFKSGNCDFTMTTCGWKSLDPHHAWSLDDKNGILFTEESEKVRLPRGYKSQLFSPILAPEGYNDNMSPENTAMCLEFEYLIQGPDAYQLNVAVENKKSGSKHDQVDHSDIIHEIDGPHGNKFLWAAVNFTVAGYFRVIFSYERGYGQHYFVAIDSIRIHNGPCVGPRIDTQHSFTCRFNESFCGWKNTHSDQRNWQLRNEGISAMDNITLTSRSSHEFTKGKHGRPFADLISPVVTSKTLFSANSSHYSEDYCLRFSYQIYSSMAELQIILASGRENLAFGEETMIWSGGKFSSGKDLEGEIPLTKDTVPDEFRVTMRTVASSQPKFVLNKGQSNRNGVLVRNITMTPGKCLSSDECSFTNGFCTWKTLTSGSSAWYIEEHDNNSFAALASNIGGDLVLLVSPQLKIKKAQSLNFRYKTNSLENQCLQIAIKKGVLSDVNDFNVSSDDVDVLWEQCKDKGNSWLNECVDLPITTEFSQIVIRTKLPKNFASFPIVWLDNIRFTPAGCYGNTDDLSSWMCSPEDSLCGLTQSSNGFWEWVFIENKEPFEEEKHSTNAGFSCLNGDIVSSNDVCNGFPDCQSAEDEMNCEYIGYPMPNPVDYHDNTNVISPVMCSDGRELNISWLCDGILDCADGSDEMNCGCTGIECAAKAQPKQPVPTDTCADGNFRCFSGTLCSTAKCKHDFCIDKSLVCDGIFHCNSREDENNCKEQRTQQDISSGGNDDRMECSGGLFIPKSFKCDGRKDCPLDGKDEIGCAHCGEEEFVCHETGLCLPWSAVCDGDLSIETCTDEDFCQMCLPGFFACDVCLDSHQICDGIWDCSDGEDEMRCLENAISSMLMGDSPAGTMYGATVPEQCRNDEFRCSDGSCLAVDSLCNRIPDCEHGDDEFNCPEDNFEKLKYISAHSETWDHSFDGSASYLTTPDMTLPTNDSYGLLSFHYRMDSWAGPANISLSVEMVNTFGNESLLPSCLWRQSGQKGRLWIKEEVVIPKMATSFQLSFVMIGASIRHRSEKIHLADLSFKPISSEDVLDLEESRHVCNFDDSWCGWNQAHARNGYTWIQTLTSPHSRRTGPLAGYSGRKNSGFLLADSLHGKTGNNADLLSPALVLPKDAAPHICLRLMVFLYGANVVGVSFHTKQRFSDHVFSKEVLKISGAQGLNWIPVIIGIAKDDLSDANEPFFLVIRATRGSGPDSDVAIDHVVLTSGACDNSSNIRIFSEAFPKHPEMYILKAGAPSTPYVKKKNYLDANSTEALEEYCSLFHHCSGCVTSRITKCSWCDEGHFCVWQNSPRAKICSHSGLISHKTVATSNSGSSFCPRIINDKKRPIYFPNNTSPILQFTVENIQKFPNSKWQCRYSIPNSQAVHMESQNFDEEMALLKELNSPDGDSAFWNLLEGFAIAEQTTVGYDVTQVSGSFQAATSSPNNSHRGGVVTCGNGQTVVNLPEGESSASVNISIITPLGNQLDNPDSVQVTIYSCEGLATNCETCVTLNSSFECGWCSLSHACILSTECLHGRWHSHQDKSVCRIRDDLDILTELLSAQDNEDDYDEQMMNTEDAEIFGASNVKKKVTKNLRKSLQSRKERYTKLEKVDANKSKRKNKDGKGKGERRRKPEENKKKDKGSRKGRRKSFLKVPFDSSVFIARNMWRLHTGKQYYIPVEKKTLLNLAFVRQVNYGDLNKEKPRTVLVDGKWKKAVGYFVDLFENAEDDPVTSIITTKQGIFDQLLGQL